jgi:hypothetical protein
MKRTTDLSYYLELQSRMLDIFRYVSCSEKNFATHSIILESLLVDSASLFDSLCQTVVREQRLSGRVFMKEEAVDKLPEKAEGRKQFTIRDYYLLLESEFLLSKKEVNLNPYEEEPYVNPLSYHPDDIAGYLMKPFEEWGGTDYVQLKWWKAFTSLKHDRLANFTQSTLWNAIHALSAAFIMLAL